MTDVICINANKACAVLSEAGVLTQNNLAEMVASVSQPAKGYFPACKVVEFAAMLNARDTAQTQTGTKTMRKPHTPLPPYLDLAVADAEENYQAAARALSAIPGVGAGTCGLTPDAVKFSPEYRAAKKRLDATFQTIRAVNTHVAKFRKQARSRRATR